MKLVLPILSARNKTNGKYQLLKDGNMHSMLNRLMFLKELNGCTLGLPSLELIDDFAEFRAILAKLPYTIKLRLGLPYGRTITKTRAKFDGMFKDECFATSIPGVKAKHYMCNTFVLSGIDQPCDAFAAKDLKSIAHAKHVYVYSEEQAELMPFKQWLIIDTNVCHPDYYSAIGQDIPFPLKLSYNELIVPFYLGNKEYSHELIYNWRGNIILLNPRKTPLPDDMISLTNIVSITDLTKAQFYGLLAAGKVVYLPTVPGIFHILQAELDYFEFSAGTRPGIWYKI